ncbi:MAG: metallophosphoesterase [Bacteroidetes bacterium]|nr:metallophosphoesterase [Bacteroidota bacterium]
MSETYDSLERQPLHHRIHYHYDVTRCDVIGDVHGCYDELAELFVRLGHEDLLAPDVPSAPPGRMPRVVFVGDIVDRGNRIVEALSLVHRLCVRGHALTVLGNHDDRFVRWLRGRPVEIQHGLGETVEQFEAIEPALRERWRDELLEFMGLLPWSVHLDGGRLIVAHAAWHAELHNERSGDRLRAYTMYGPTTGQQTPEGYPERIDWAPHFLGPELVVFGHQVYDAPYWHDYAIGIDTGCVFGGALTALRYPSMEIVSVPSRGARWLRRGGRADYRG